MTGAGVASDDRPRSSDLSTWRPLGQVGLTYVVAEAPDGLYLIDQHSAHERVQYEALKAATAGSTGTRSQALLVPEALDLTGAQGAWLRGNLTLLETLGFVLEPFGDPPGSGGSSGWAPDTWLVRAVPRGVAARGRTTDVAALIDGLIEREFGPEAQVRRIGQAVNAMPPQDIDGHNAVVAQILAASRAAYTTLTLPEQRREFVTWLHGLLTAMRERTPFFGCFGLHEWAMVHRQTPAELRHNAWPLRLGPDETARVVEEATVTCSHFDAFRFFTPSARPLNRLQPTRAEVPRLEQRGCLHANMDLYKWAFKLAPFTPATLVADCFALAVAIREVDMRASPYDLRGLGFEPIAVETSAGRAEYERNQRVFAARGEPLRARLVVLCDQLLAVINGLLTSLLKISLIFKRSHSTCNG